MMNTTIILLSVAIVGLGIYVTYLHHQIKMRDYAIEGILSGAIKILEVKDE